MNMREVVNALLDYDPDEVVMALNINSEEGTEAVEIVQITSDDDGIVQIEYSGEVAEEV